PKIFGANPARQVKLMAEYGLKPSESVHVNGAEIKVSDLFDIGDSRVGALMEVTVDGETYLRSIYRSSSQGGFPVLPAKNARATARPGYDKGLGEHTLQVPTEVEQILATKLTRGQLRTDLPPQAATELFEGMVVHNENANKYMSYQASSDFIGNNVRE